MELSIRQKAVLDYIENYILINGYPPTQKEICKALEFKYLNSVFGILGILERKGYISTKPGKARAIKVLRSLREC